MVLREVCKVRQAQVAHDRWVLLLAACRDPLVANRDQWELLPVACAPAECPRRVDLWVRPLAV